MFLKAIPKSGAGIHHILLNSVIHAPQSFFDKTDSGITLNRFSQDMSLVDGMLPGSVIIALQGEFTLAYEFPERQLTQHHSSL